MVFLVKTVQEAFADKDVLRAIIEDRYAGEWFDEEQIEEGSTEKGSGDMDEE
jgi:hypothetical protein